MNNTILHDVKVYIGLNPDVEDTTFDESIVIFVNSAIDDLARIGLGELGQFRLIEKNETWTDYLGDTYAFLVSSVKSYICIYTRLHFDPPQGSIQSALDEQLRKLEFTIQTAIEQLEISEG